MTICLCPLPHAWNECEWITNRDLTLEQCLDDDTGSTNVHRFPGGNHDHGSQHTEMWTEQTQLIGSKSFAIMVNNLTRDSGWLTLKHVPQYWVKIPDTNVTNNGVNEIGIRRVSVPEQCRTDRHLDHAWTRSQRQIRRWDKDANWTIIEYLIRSETSSRGIRRWMKAKRNEFESS